jgi:hypothetical protein
LVLEVATDGDPSLEASFVSIPIQALVAPSVCHVIGMLTTEVGVGQSTSPAGKVLEPKEVMTAAAAAGAVDALVEGWVLGGVVVGDERVVLGDVVGVGVAEGFAGREMVDERTRADAGAAGAGAGDGG